MGVQGEPQQGARVDAGEERQGHRREERGEPPAVSEEPAQHPGHGDRAAQERSGSRQQQQVLQQVRGDHDLAVHVQRSAGQQHQHDPAEHESHARTAFALRTARAPPQQHEHAGEHHAEGVRTPGREQGGDARGIGQRVAGEHAGRTCRRGAGVGRRRGGAHGRGERDREAHQGELEQGEPAIGAGGLPARGVVAQARGQLAALQRAEAGERHQQHRLRDSQLHIGAGEDLGDAVHAHGERPDAAHGERDPADQRQMGVAAQHGDVVPRAGGQHLEDAEAAQPDAHGEQVHEHRGGRDLMARVPGGVAGHGAGEGDQTCGDGDHASGRPGGAREGGRRRGRRDHQRGDQPEAELRGEEDAEVGAEALGADGLAGRDRIGEGERGAAGEGGDRGGDPDHGQGAGAIRVLAQQPSGDDRAAQGERRGEISEHRGDR